MAYLERRRFLQLAALAGAGLLLGTRRETPSPKKILEMRTVTGDECAIQQVYLRIFLPQGLPYSLVAYPEQINPSFAQTYKAALQNMCYLWGLYDNPDSDRVTFRICNGFILNDAAGNKHLATACHNLGLLSNQSFFFKPVLNDTMYHVTANHFLTTRAPRDITDPDDHGTALLPLPPMLGACFTGFDAAQHYNGQEPVYCLRPDFNTRLDLIPAHPALPPNIYTYYNQADMPAQNILCRGVSGTPVLNEANQVTGYLSHGEEVVDDGCAYSLYARNLAKPELDGEYNTVFV